MKVIIAGSRNINDAQLIYNILDDIYKYNIKQIDEVVCGMARGVDLIGRDWAISKGIAVSEFPAQWEKHGTATAGHKRNELMAKHADALILIWDGYSTGSKDMLIRARKHKLLIDLNDQSQYRLFHNE